MAFDTLEDMIGIVADRRQQIICLLGASQVVRFHNKPCIKQNTDAHHSWGVAMIAYLLSENPSLNLIMACLSHDMGEQVWSDVSYPAKIALGIQQMLQDKEDATLKENGFGFDISPEEARILKIADALDGMLYCVAERRMGNRNLDSAMDRWMGNVNPYAPEVSTREREIINIVFELWREVCTA